MENGVYAADAAPKRPARPQSAHPSRRPQRPASAVRPAPARPSSAPPRPLAAYRGRRVLRFVGLPAPGTPETKTLSQRYDVKLPSDGSLMLARASAEERVQLHLEVRCQIHQLDTAEPSGAMKPVDWQALQKILADVNPAELTTADFRPVFCLMRALLLPSLFSFESASSIGPTAFVFEVPIHETSTAEPSAADDDAIAESCLHTRVRRPRTVFTGRNCITWASTSLSRSRIVVCGWRWAMVVSMSGRGVWRSVSEQPVAA